MRNLRFGTLVAAFITLSTASCGGGKVEEIRDPVIRPVKLIKVDEASKVETSRFPAVVGASRISDLSMQVGGLITELPVNEAQDVERGQVIAKLDQRDFLANLQAAKAEFNNANSEYKRAEGLAKEKAIAVSVLEQRRAQRDIAKAQLDSAEKALEDTVLKAPFNGVIAQVSVKKLQNISGGTSIALLMATDLLEATINLPASFIARIPKNENPETSNRKAFVFLDAAPNKIIEATFKEASLIADTASQTYAVTFSFSPPVDLNILPGMNATMELSRDASVKGIRVAVPLDAVLSDGENKFVWLVNPDTMKVSKQAVSIEDGVGNMVVVTQGLSDTQMIVGAGASYLSEDMQVSEWKN